MTTSGSTPTTAADLLHVAAAVIVDGRGRVLIAQRPAAVHQGGLWEFPGGKVESGEDVRSALARELWEELHIRPRVARPLIRVPYHYPDRAVLLDVWRVERYDGTPEGREGQPIRWVELSRLREFAFPAANSPIVSAATLPELCLITGPAANEAEFLVRLQRGLEQGPRMVQLRGEALSDRLIAQAQMLCARAGALLVLNGDPARAERLRLEGVHLPAWRLAALEERPLPRDRWVGASCHDAAELARAVAVGVDYALLSPVAPTPSHPERAALGWERFCALVRDCPIPVYALGGMRPEHLPQALASRAQGIAAIGAWWG